MKNPKAYLFWYITAGLLVAMIVVMVVITPTDAEGRDAETVKQALDSEYSGKWVPLEKRAKSGSPEGVFDAESQVDISRLTKDYLITERWQPILEPLVRKYGDNYDRIKADLVQRSEVLRDPVGDTSQRGPWYLDGYARKSDALLADLVAANALVEPPAASGAGAPTPDEVNRRRRDLAGFVTQTDPYPDQKDHPKLTAQFRIVEAVAKVILATQSEPVLPNPVFGADYQPPVGAVKLAGITWSPQDTRFEGEMARFATNIRLTVALRGQESALAAAIARLEKLDKPLTVMLGASVRRQDKFAAGDRAIEASPGVSAPAVAADATVDLLVLDFAPFAAAPSIKDQVAASAPKGAPKAGAGKGKK